MSGFLHRLRNKALFARLARLPKPWRLFPGISLGLVVFLSALLGACLLSALSLETRGQMFMAGDVATRDVTADQNLRVEDREATQHKREQMAENQPPVFDLNPDIFKDITDKIHNALDQVRKQEGDDLEKMRWQLSEDLNTEIGRDTLATLRSPEFQDLMLNQVLPWLKAVYSRGVVATASELTASKNGFLLRELPSGMETLLVENPGIPDLEQVRDRLDFLLKVDLRKSFRLRKTAAILAGAYLEPDLLANPSLTQTRKNEVMSAVEPVFYSLNRGEIIVRLGERVSPEQQTKLQALYTHRSPAAKLWAVPGMFILSGLFLVLLHLSQGRKMGIRTVPNRDWLMMALLVAMFAIMGKFVELMRYYSDAQIPMFIKSTNMAYGLPIAGAAGVMAMFLPQALVSFFVLLLSFMVTNELGGGLYLFSYYLLSGLVYAYIIKDSENRQAVMRSIFPLAGLLLVMWLGASLVDYQGLDKTLCGGVYALINAIFSQLMVLGLSPILELIFGYTSRFKLMELMSLEQPLLQELMVKAPGTHHHSVIVANMVEAGARAIRANALLAKVAALYHDIGKLKNPQYFIENLFGKENRHNKLSPSMSALILISHVKKGVELAREYHLGEEIAALIGQHHGMTLIAFFYHKAQELAETKNEEPVSEDEFRYPGPKPQTKEAGLILLADAIEASSRTLVDPTPSRIKGHIQSIVRKIYTEGELDESELTLKDLTLISETFHRILTGIFHHRIEYPSADRADKLKKPSANGTNRGEKAA